MKVFLGGTCNGSKWREALMKLFNKEGIEYFNPVVEDWTPAHQAEELKQRNNCDWVLYVVTPMMTGVYSIAEVVDDSNKKPKKTIFCYVNEKDKQFDAGQTKSLTAVGNLVVRNGANWVSNFEEIVKLVKGK